MTKYSSLTRSKYKFIYTFFGAIVGLAGITMGVVLVMQPQLLGEKAATSDYGTPSTSMVCGAGLDCRIVSGGTRPVGATRCVTPRGQHAYCCKANEKIINGRCVSPTSTPRAFPTSGPCSTVGSHKCETFNGGGSTGRLLTCGDSRRWIASSCASGACSGGACVPVTGGCFLAGTKVASANGLRSIENITVGDSVLSFDSNRNVEKSKVDNFYKVTRDHYYHLVTAAATVDVTAEHPFYNGTDYTETQNLKAGDMVYLLNGSTISEAMVVSNTRIDKEVEAFNLSVDTNNTFIANGFAVHNKTLGGATETSCDTMARNKGFCGNAYSSGSYNPLTITDPDRKGYCTSDSVYLGSKLTGYVPPRATTCCIKPSDNNSCSTNFCAGMSGSVSVSFYYDNGQSNHASQRVNYSCKTEASSNCINEYKPNFESILNQLISTNQGAGRVAASNIPSGTAKSCSWLGGNSTGNLRPGYCCP